MKARNKLDDLYIVGMEIELAVTYTNFIEINALITSQSMCKQESAMRAIA
jgi:hypothetical protein